MRKIFSYCGSAASKVCLTLMLLMGAIAAYAATPITEVNQVLEGGVTYSYPGKFTPVSAQYTPTATGTLRMEGFKEFAIYRECITPGAQYGGLLETNEYQAIDPVGNIRTFSVTAGQTVYFVGSVYDAGEVTLYMEGKDVSPLKLQYMQPEPGKVVDFNNYTGINATFDHDITCSEQNAEISFKNRTSGATETVLSRVSVSGKSLVVPFYGILKPYIASGAIEVGDEFTVTVKGLLSESGQQYVGAEPNGDIVFTYLCGSIPTVANTKYCPDPFLSYWPKGTPEGILKITFDKTLGKSDKTKGVLRWGNSEGEVGEYYVEEIPAQVDGNILTVDFTGVLRTPATMTPLYPNSSYSTMMVDVTGIVDEFGVPVGSDGQGTTGSYAFIPNYKVLDRTAIAAEFEPANGSDLDLAKNVNVWISGTKGFSFDGFQVEYTDKNTGLVGKVVVPMSDVKVTPDGTDAAEYDFAMPAAVLSNASKAVITLSNIVALDGYNHDNDVRVVYGGFVVTYSDPANGAEMATLNQGSVITMEANIAEKYPNMYVEYEIINLQPEEGEEATVKTTSWMTRQEDGSYSSEVFGNFKLMYGKEYKVLFTAWEDEMTKNYTPDLTLGDDYVIWKGMTPPYIYSTVTLTEANPANEASLAEGQNQIAVTFDGIVRIGSNSGVVIGAGAGISKFSKITPVEPEEVDGTTYASTWILEKDGLSSSSEPVLISFQAFDEEGRLVKGNEGIDETSCFQFYYYPAGMFRELTVDFGQSPITSVKEIIVGNPEGVMESYEFLYSDVKVYDRQYNVVATMQAYEPIYKDPDNWDEVPVTGKIILDNTVTQEGGYTLVIPRGFFNIGTQFSSFKNDDVNFPFTISAAPYILAPEAGNVTSLIDVTVTYLDGNIKINEEATQKPYFTFSGEEGNFSFSNVNAIGANLELTFRAEQNDPGTYTVTVPAGFVLFEDGTEAPAVTAVYTIEAAAERPNITVTPAEGEVTELTSPIAIWFNDYDGVGGGSGKATLSFNGGNPVNLPDTDYDFEDEALNKILQPLPQNYTEAGTYVISFPAGYFLLGDNGDASPAFDLTYTIAGGSDTPSYDAVFTPAPGAVTSLSTIDIVFPKEEEIGINAGLPTLSINDGTPVKLDDAILDWDIWNKATLTLPETYTADGTYAITFPAAYFSMGPGLSEYSQEMTIVYTIGENTGVEAVDVLCNDYTVYTAGGVLVLRNADRDAFKALAPGLYIVNGVKIVKK